MSFTVRQSVKNINTTTYGVLYNWYAVTDPRLICNIGWHVPSDAEWTILSTYLEVNGYGYGGTGSDIGKSIATKTNWITSLVEGNVGYDITTNNLSLLSIPPGGYRYAHVGHFSSMFNGIYFWSSTPHVIPGYAITRGLTYDNSNFFTSAYGYSGGEYVRLFKDSTTLLNGEEGTYTGNDSKVYRTICIGTQEIIIDNLAETKYRDSSNIPIVTENAIWGALTSGAMCAYDNDWSNVQGRNIISPKAFSVTQSNQKVFTFLNVLLCGVINDEMKYLQTVSLTGGAVTDITTTLTSEPYNVFVLDSAGNELGDPEIGVSLALVGGVYHIYVYSAIAIPSVKVKILY